MLLDAASIYFRAFHGIPESIKGPDGTPVNAVRGMLDVIARLVRDHRPARLVACMDADWRPAFRVAAVPAYKAHRLAPNGGEAVPPGLVPQVPIIEAVLDALGIARVGVPGYEADDVIGTIAHVDPGPVDVVSGDRDLFQVVRDDKPVRVLYTKSEVCRRYGIPGRSYADFALLRGDPSDGLPGVPGVGEKTAAGLISTYGSVEALLRALDAGEPVPMSAKLRAAREYLEAAGAVVRVARDVPLPDYDDALPATARDPAALVELSERHNLDGPLNRVLSAFHSGQPTDE
jgi:5'-3' exonuclease